MKDSLEILFKYLIGTPIYVVGCATVALFILSRIPEYSFISKAVVLYLLTH